MNISKEQIEAVIDAMGAEGLVSERFEDRDYFDRAVERVHAALRGCKHIKSYNDPAGNRRCQKCGIPV